MEKTGPQALGSLKARIATGVTTTFASHYSKEVCLPEVLSASAISAYAQRATGTK
jgi:NADPH2:quinone reductase